MNTQSQRGDPFVGMILLDHDKPPIIESLIEEMKRQGTDTEIQVNISNDQTPSQSMVIKFGTNVVAAMFIPASVPPGTLDQAVRGNFQWPTASAALSRQSAHIIVGNVSLESGLSGRITAAANVTKVVSALLAVVPSLGAYWVSSQLVVQPKEFIASAARLKDGGMPLDVWVRLHFLRGATDGDAQLIGVVTTGLIDYLGREIEFDPTKIQPATVADRVMGFVSYLLSTGATVNNGDTIGVSQSERIIVRLRDRGRSLAKPVYALALEVADI